MNRKKELLKHVSKGARGIEIGPYFSPLAPKREGYNCLSLDVFDTEAVRRRARLDPSLPEGTVDLIEPVDLVGSATDIDALCRDTGVAGELDYILSSHNFEHFPNPIAFLQACGRVLKPGGVLSMALPDKRACFDFFRPLTGLGAMIEAFHEGRSRPTYRQIFEQNAQMARFVDEERSLVCFLLDEKLEKIVPERRLREAFDAWEGMRAANDPHYHDVHCWTFTPASFRLLLSDLFFLGLSPFVVEEATDTGQSDFVAHLRLVGYTTFSPAETEDYYAAREAQLRVIVREDWSVAKSDCQLEILERFHILERSTRRNSLVIAARALALLAARRDPFLVKQYLAISRSVFFDPLHYVETYGDAGDPALHYLLEGAAQGSDPGPFFSSRKYLARNPDVAAESINPLAHFEMFGRKEGRRPALR